MNLNGAFPVEEWLDGSTATCVRHVWVSVRVDQIARQINGKRQVVACVQEQRCRSRNPVKVPARADRFPQIAKVIELDSTVEAVPDVSR